MKPNLPENFYFSPCRPNGNASPAALTIPERRLVHAVLGGNPQALINAMTESVLAATNSQTATE